MSRLRTAIMFCCWPAMILAASGALRAQEGGALNPVARQALPHLTETLERPLFVPSRHKLAPPAPVLSLEAPPPPPPPAPPSVVLLGILKSANTTLAVLRMNGTEKIARVGLGDDVGGWKVAEIAARHVTLSLDDRTASVTLFQNQGLKPLLGSEDNARGP